MYFTGFYIWKLPIFFVFAQFKPSTFLSCIFYTHNFRPSHFNDLYNKQVKFVFHDWDAAYKDYQVTCTVT